MVEILLHNTFNWKALSFYQRNFITLFAKKPVMIKTYHGELIHLFYVVVSLYGRVSVLN